MNYCNDCEKLVFTLKQTCFWKGSTKFSLIIELCLKCSLPLFQYLEAKNEK